MIVEKSMHETWHSNSWLVGSRPGGTAVIVDSGAPIEPLLAAVDRHRLQVTHVVNTHDHRGHTLNAKELVERYDVPLLLAESVTPGEVIESGALRLQPLATPGHAPEHVAWRIIGSADRDDASGSDSEVVCTGDVLLRETVGTTLGGGDDGFAQLRHSVLDVLLDLPPMTRLLPGHADETTVQHELAANAFVRIWRGIDAEGTEIVRVAGNECTLILQTPNDVGSRAWVRFSDGRDAIVGGNLVERTVAGHGASHA